MGGYRVWLVFVSGLISRLAINRYHFEAVENHVVTRKASADHAGLRSREGGASPVGPRQSARVFSLTGRISCHLPLSTATARVHEAAGLRQFQVRARALEPLLTFHVVCGDLRLNLTVDCVPPVSSSVQFSRHRPAFLLRDTSRSR